jgi:alkylhydroperoxidase family enzyme
MAFVHRGKVSRLPSLPDPLPADVQAQFAERERRLGRLLNLHFTLGHALKLGAASMGMAVALRNETSVGRLWVEIAIVRAAQLAEGHYELQQHEPMLLAEGFPREKLDALRDWKASKLFDERERALLAYVDEMCDRGNVSDATFAAMERHFNAQQILELSFAAGTYYGTALVMNALQIQLERKS